MVACTLTGGQSVPSTVWIRLLRCPRGQRVGSPAGKMTAVDIRKSVIRILIMPTDKQAHSGDVIVTPANIYLHLCCQGEQLDSCWMTVSVVLDIGELILQSSDCIFNASWFDLTNQNICSASSVVCTGSFSFLGQNLNILAYFFF